MGDDVLSDRADVLVRKDDIGELDPPSVDETDVLADHDRVEGLGQGITGVDNLIGVASKYERRVFAYPDGVASPHGDPVHGGSVERGLERSAQMVFAVIRPAAFPMGTSSVSTRFRHEASTHAAYQSSRASSTVVIGHPRPS